MSKLDNYCLNITDGEHGTVLDDDNGEFFLLSNKNIIDGKIIITDKDRKIDKDTFEKINKRTVLEEGDVVVATVGTLGKTAVIKDEINYVFQRSVGIIKPKQEILNSYFLKYILDNPLMQKRIHLLSKGAVQKCLFISDLKNLDIDIPDIKTQKLIVKVLKNIDDKINNNNKINEELENMAKTIYDYWFLQFDFPDENGKPYKSSGGKMIWNEELKKEIPEGWEVGNLYDIADFINGLACQKYRPINEEHILPVIKIGEMHDGFTSNTEYVRSDIDEKYIVNNGDILFSWSATLETMVWTNGRGGLNQHIFKVNPKKYPKYYVFLQLSSYIINFIKMAEARKTTMGHITKDHIKQSKIVLPPIDITNRYEKKIDKIFNQIINNEKQNQQLSSLRDFLLPLLMNGQVGFKGLNK